MWLVVTGLLYMAHLNSAVTHFNTPIIGAATAPVTTGQCLLLKLSNIIRYYQKTSHR